MNKLKDMLDFFHKDLHITIFHLKHAQERCLSGEILTVLPIFNMRIAFLFIEIRKIQMK